MSESELADLMVRLRHRGGVRGEGPSAERIMEWIRPLIEPAAGERTARESRLASGDRPEGVGRGSGDGEAGV